MHKPAIAASITAALMALAACGGGDEATGLTRAEQRELDADAARLDAAQDELDAALQDANTAEAAAPDESDEH